MKISNFKFDITSYITKTRNLSNYFMYMCIYKCRVTITQIFVRKDETSSAIQTINQYLSLN